MNNKIRVNVETCIYNKAYRIRQIRLIKVKNSKNLKLNDKFKNLS